MDKINVVVNGAHGKMGQEIVGAVCKAGDLELVGAASRSATDGTLALPDSSSGVPLSNRLENVISGANVVVDVTSAEGAMNAIRVAAQQKVNVVTGSTGLSDENLDEAEHLATENGIGIIVAPNFAVGAVLMIHLAKLTSPFFDYAELVETHHEAKIDAPSGTAIAIAKAAIEGKGGSFMATKAEKQILEGTRGGVYDGVSIHSARMPGRVAHHELVFGGLGQTLTIRHDSISRESFMPGVIMSIREVMDRPGLTVGLEKIMGLE